MVGKLGFGEGSKVIPMLTEALVQTQWASPMFIRARAQIDVGGWDIIVGSASLFIGENLEKGRVDFEGMALLQNTDTKFSAGCRRFRIWNPCRRE